MNFYYIMWWKKSQEAFIIIRDFGLDITMQNELVIFSLILDVIVVQQKKNKHILIELHDLFLKLRRVRVPEL